MKNLFLIFFLLFTFTTFAQQTLIKVGGWNAYVHLPSGYNSNPTKNYPAILFIPGLGEIGTDANRVIANGPGSYIKQGWNGEALGVKFIIINLQPPTAWPGAASVKNRVDILKSMYRIDGLYMTGLSMGGWASMMYAATYPSELKSIVSVEGVDIGYASDMNQLWKGYATSGGKMINFEQINDYRLGDKAVAAMNYWTSGSAQYIETNFGGGGHCCWNEFYGGNGKQPGRFAEIGGQTLYEWIASDYLQVLPEFITSLFVQDKKLSWAWENTKPGDVFIVEESEDGKNFKKIAQVDVRSTERKYTIKLP